MVSTKKYKSEKKYINASYVEENNLKGKSLIIDSVFPETINEEDKLCIRFSGVEKLLALNQTNIAILENKYGDDTDNWINHKVSLILVKVKYQGNMVDGIQVAPS